MRVEIEPPADVDFTWLEAEVERAVEATLKGCAMVVANDAKQSVARGPKTGRIYTTRFATNRTTGGVFPTGERVPHQASAAGEPPATDTGKLVGSIVGDGKGLRAYVEARSVYAVWLEYGTRRIAARPFMVPAFERNRERCANLMRAAISSAVSRFQLKVR
jgi:HK97 gp10 family phage protein